jgi:hypothetical protein
MSYASRLAAMSRGHVPPAPPRALGGDAEPPREEVVETEARVPRSAQPVGAVTPRTGARTDVPPVTSPGPELREHAVSVESSVGTREPASAATTVTRERTIEHHTIVEAAPPAPRRVTMPAQPAAVTPPQPLPPQARWLAEDTTAADPLVATTEDDAVRELMQTVRQWTASAPTVIESGPREVAAEPAPSVAPVVVAPQTQVSIGNVTITVDDAPAEPARATAASPRTTSDRMARNHIRGG